MIYTRLTTLSGRSLSVVFWLRIRRGSRMRSFVIFFKASQHSMSYVFCIRTETVPFEQVNSTSVIQFIGFAPLLCSVFPAGRSKFIFPRIYFNWMIISQQSYRILPHNTHRFHGVHRRNLLNDANVWVRRSRITYRECNIYIVFVRHASFVQRFSLNDTRPS